VPKAITVDNGTQFDAETFKDFCDRICTKIHFASVRHPELNGLVERENGIIMTGIMKLIFNQPRGKWPDELINGVFGLRNDIVHHLLTPHFFVWFVEWSELIHHHLIPHS
jgi:transposase InsO family protein